jgi:hypothetical protein
METAVNGPNLTVAVEFHILLLTLAASWVVLVLQPGQWGVAMALLAGSITAFVDVQSSEVQLPAVMLIGFGSMIGFQEGKRPWLSALLLGAFVPAARLTEIAMGATNSGRLAEALGSVGAIAFALLGVGAGILIKKLGRRNACSKSGPVERGSPDQSSLP